MKAGVALMAEQGFRKPQDAGSNPATSSTCIRCQGLIVHEGVETRCVNCGHRPKPLRPHEVKELRALETVTVMHSTIPRCHRCAKPAETGMRLCEKHRKLNALYVQQAKKRKMVSTSFLTRTVSHVTQNTQGV